MSMMRIVLFLVAVAAVLCAVAVPLVLRRLREQTGFVSDTTGLSRIVASDTGAASTLIVRDENIGVVGKPDYVVQEGLGGRQRLVPIEVKPTRRSRRLYDGDRLQLGVYLLGLRAMAGDGAAGVGYVRYAAATFEVRLTSALERELATIAGAIRTGRRTRVMHRSHEMPARCRSCTVRSHCNESLSD